MLTRRRSTEGHDICSDGPDSSHCKFVITTATVHEGKQQYCPHERPLNQRTKTQADSRHVSISWQKVASTSAPLKLDLQEFNLRSYPRHHPTCGRPTKCLVCACSAITWLCNHYVHLKSGRHFLVLAIRCLT